MSPARLRPEMRLPWQALAIAAVIFYVIESALRGWDFRPTVLDAIVFGGLAAIILLRPLIARWMSEDEEDVDAS